MGSISQSYRRSRAVADVKLLDRRAIKNQIKTGCNMHVQDLCDSNIKMGIDHTEFYFILYFYYYVYNYEQI